VVRGDLTTPVRPHRDGPAQAVTGLVPAQRVPQEHAPQPAPAPHPGPGLARRAVRWALLLALVGALLLLRATVATPVRVSSASMEPTLDVGDVVLVTQQPPAPDDVDRGELVTFVSPEDGRRTVKRVIGLPGDTVVIKDSVLYVNDRVVDEPYVDHALIDAYYSRTYTVSDGTVFLLGDNRGNSIDSRDYGPVPFDDLLGRVLVRLWPVVRVGEPVPSPPRTS
jgi:signal peptidase I